MAICENIPAAVTTNHRNAVGLNIVIVRSDCCCCCDAHLTRFWKNKHNTNHSASCSFFYLYFFFKCISRLIELRQCIQNCSLLFAHYFVGTLAHCTTASERVIENRADSSGAFFSPPGNYDTDTKSFTHTFVLNTRIFTTNQFLNGIRVI